MYGNGLLLSNLTNYHDGDPWIVETNRSDLPHDIEPEPPAHVIMTIGGVEPLDAQLGVFPKKTVPDTLYDALFGQPDPIDVEVEAAGGDTQVVPPIQTYAILDAAKFTNLPELLAESDLECACMFKGDAFEELKEVAPWIVKLEEASGFTRNLFTRSASPWHLWDRETGVFIRSRDRMTVLQSHLRKFFRIRDESGAWFYLRLHDPRVMRALAREASRLSQRIMVRRPQGYDLSIITCLDGSAEIVVPTAEAIAEPTPIRIGSREKAIFRRLTLEARGEGLIAELETRGVVGAVEDCRERQERKNLIVAAFERMHHYGFQQPLQQNRWAVWEIFYGAGFERHDPILSQICHSRDASSGERFALFQRRLEELYP